MQPAALPVVSNVGCSGLSKGIFAGTSCEEIRGTLIGVGGPRLALIVPGQVDQSSEQVIGDKWLAGR
jgi:hypothetical protein